MIYIFLGEVGAFFNESTSTKTDAYREASNVRNRSDFTHLCYLVCVFFGVSCLYTQEKFLTFHFLYVLVAGAA